MNDARTSRAKALSRRRFLGVVATGTIGLPLLLPSGLRAAAPGGRLSHACIGVTRMGLNDLKNFQSHPRVQIVALCDVDRQHLEKSAKLVPGARLYTDWRELFAKEGDKIDSVNVTTPDHMHFPIAYTAVKRGKHVYCQKPMCHDLAEVRKLVAAVKQQGVVTQLGTQHASEIGDRMTTQYLREGVIGRIKHVYLCSNREAPNRVAGPRPAQGEPPPDYLNWDLWLGTAPTRPFAADAYHPAKWRGWQDFGTSWCADMGCHIFDATWRALELTAPKRIVAQVEQAWKDSPARRADNWPQSEHITWTFAGGPLVDGPELTVEWFDGPMLPPPEAQAHYPSGAFPKEAALVVGTEGTLLQNVGSGPLLLPREKFQNRPRPKLPPRNHYHHFVDACLGGEQTQSSLPQTAAITETILLGTVAIRCCERELQWDGAAMKFPNYPQAERYLQRSYREGWQIA